MSLQAQVVEEQRPHACRSSEVGAVSLCAEQTAYASAADFEVVRAAKTVIERAACMSWCGPHTEFGVMPLSDIAKRARLFCDFVQSLEDHT